MPVDMNSLNYKKHYGSEVIGKSMTTHPIKTSEAFLFFGFGLVSVCFIEDMLFIFSLI